MGMTVEKIAIDGHTRLVALLRQSAQPGPSLRIFNAAFQARGLNWRCIPLSVQKGKLGEALVGLQALGFVGAQLAEPYQQDALSYLKESSRAAETIGIADLVKLDDRGRLAGANIRWLGFLAALRTMIPSLNGLRPLVIGAGPAARGIVYALTREGLPLTIVDERMDQAIDLVRRLRHVLAEHSFSVYRWPQDLARVSRDATLIINATNIGMWPGVDYSPWPDDLSFPPNALVLDLVSWPSETRFLRQAQAAGAKTISGLSLLVYQAAVAFEEWTGLIAPTEVMWQVAREKLAQGTPHDIARPKSVLEGSALPQPA